MASHWYVRETDGSQFQNLTNPGVSLSTTGTSNPGDGPSELEATVIGDLEHSVHLEEEGPCKEQLQSLCFLCYSVHDKR